jgi:aldose 1-epimerase
MSTLYVLENDVWQVGLLPETGMSTAFGRIRHRADFLDFMRPAAPSSYDKSSACASYLLIPWSNRLSGGHFLFRGKGYQLRLNSSDGTAIHGTARDYPWRVEHADGRHLRASFESRRHENVNFPFPFLARAEFSLEGGRFVNRLTIKNEGESAMPAGLGHHPYFQRALVAETGQVRLEIPCSQYFPARNCIPTGPPIGVDERLDFQIARPVGSVFIDDCLTGRLAARPIVFSYPEATVTLEADDLFEHVVLYAPVGANFFAVEPVTNANDGFNLYEQGARSSGVFVLEPGEERTASFTLAQRESS